MQDFGFVVQGLRLGLQGFGFRVPGLRLISLGHSSTRIL